MPSFDIVSRTELTEVDNAVNGAMREISTRYDFKGSSCSIERADAILTIKADDDFKLNIAPDNTDDAGSAEIQADGFYLEGGIYITGGFDFDGPDFVAAVPPAAPEDRF